MKKLTILHLWRIGAGAMFLFYGSQKILPETFVRNMGYGDVAVGLLVIVVESLKNLVLPVGLIPLYGDGFSGVTCIFAFALL